LFSGGNLALEERSIGNLDQSRAVPERVLKTLVLDLDMGTAVQSPQINICGASAKGAVDISFK
jgi:hypothetical protein